MVIALKNLSKKIIFGIFLNLKKNDCLSLCESINATCQAACNADMGCLQECSQEFIDCTSFCPQVKCDVSSLSLEEKKSNSIGRLGGVFTMRNLKSTGGRMRNTDGPWIPL